MSWPDDGRPRYVVSLVTGYRITPGSTSYSASHTPPTCAAVLDRAFAHRVLAEFVPGNGGNLSSSSQCIGRAEQVAAELNALEEVAADGEGLA